MIKIGSKKIDTNVFMAPLSGCSDLAFRLMAREHGAKFAFYEMVDAHSLVCGPTAKTVTLLKTHPKDRPIAGQLVGNDPDVMVRAAKMMLKLVDIEFLDINAACPKKKILRKKAGAYLLRDSERLAALVKSMVESLPLPVTVKIRLADDDAHKKDAPLVAKKCEEAGASAIFVHGRTRLQGYSGDVDYSAIKRIRDAVKVPVFGSGNIFSAELASKMLKETGCDGITVARGAMGNPWIFKEIDEYLKNGKVPGEIGLKAKKEALKKHLHYVDIYKDVRPQGKIGFMRKVALWYLRGFPDAAKVRKEITIVNGYDKMLQLIDSIST